MRAAGYILSLLGLVALVFSFDPIYSKLHLPVGITKTILMIAGFVLVILGVFIMNSGGRSGKQATEVPIYHGKHIVGYRRV